MGCMGLKQDTRLTTSGLSRFVRPSVVLQRQDQTTLALAGLVLGCVMAACFWFQQGSSSEWVELDHTQNHVIQYQVDINQADWPEIANIPNVGSALAQTIVSHRTNHGPFFNDQQLQSVPGVGPSKLKRLKEHILPLNLDDTSN